jgi:hypothetical protein
MDRQLVIGTLQSQHDAQPGMTLHRDGRNACVYEPTHPSRHRARGWCHQLLEAHECLMSGHTMRTQVLS